MSTTAVRGIAGAETPARRPRSRRTVVPLVVGGLATIALGVAVASSIVNRNAVSGSSARLETQVAVLGHQLAATNRKLAITNRKLAIAERRLGSLGGRLSASASALRSLQSDNSSVWKSISALHVSLDRLATRCSRAAGAAWQRSPARSPSNRC